MEVVWSCLDRRQEHREEFAGRLQPNRAALRSAAAATDSSSDRQTTRVTMNSSVPGDGNRRPSADADGETYAVAALLRLPHCRTAAPLAEVICVFVYLPMLNVGYRPNGGSRVDDEKRLCANRLDKQTDEWSAVTLSLVEACHTGWHIGNVRLAHLHSLMIRCSVRQ